MTPPPSTPTPALGPAAASAINATLEKSPDWGQVDRVGPDDGALWPDGVKDFSFVTQVEGPITAVFLLSVDDQGAPTGQFQADTLVGDQRGPAALGGRQGGGTSGIGVVEAGKVLNMKDGSLPPLAAGPHRLTLYVAQTATLTLGLKLRVHFLRPDQSLLSGATATN